MIASCKAFQGMLCILDRSRFAKNGTIHGDNGIGTQANTPCGQPASRRLGVRHPFHIGQWRFTWPLTFIHVGRDDPGFQADVPQQFQPSRRCRCQREIRQTFQSGGAKAVPYHKPSQKKPTMGVIDQQTLHEHLTPWLART